MTWTNLFSYIEQAYDQDDWDSDFDDDFGGGSTTTTTHNNANQGSGGMLGVPKNTALTGSTGDVSSISGGKKPSVAGYTSFNRFSTFVKSGGESFVLGKLNATVQEADFIQVVVIP